VRTGEYNVPIVQASTVRHAAEIVGGVEVLAAQLDVGGEDIDAWLAGKAAIPDHIFLRCVNMLVACLLDELSATHAKAEGSLHRQEARSKSG
jgi:hypothetical protein